MNYFSSIIEIEFCFAQFAFGFDNFNKRKKYLLSAPFLIEKRAVDIITDFVNREKYLSDNIASRLFRNLLKACAVIGIDDAFLEFDTPDEKYVDVVNILMSRESLTEVLIFWGEYKEAVSSHEMRNVFHYLQAQFERGKVQKNKILALWDIISPHQSDKREESGIGSRYQYIW